MPVQRLMHLVETDAGLMVRVRWRGLPASEDTDEPIQRVHEDIPGLFQKLLLRKNTPSRLAEKACRVLGL